MVGLGSTPNEFKKNTYDWYLDKHKIVGDQVRECPICLLEFDGLDAVQGLECSVLHLYHKKCLDTLKHSGTN